MGYASDKCLFNEGSFTEQQNSRARCHIHLYLSSWRILIVFKKGLIQI